MSNFSCMNFVVVFLIVLGLYSELCQGNCEHLCTTNIHRVSEDYCTQYRNKIPRPRLYGVCTMGHTAGAIIGCKESCNDVQVSAAAAEMDIVCKSQGTPRKVSSACMDGFFRAVEDAKEEAKNALDPRRRAELLEIRKQKLLDDEEFRKRKLSEEAKANKGKRKRKLAAESTLEQARREARDALKAGGL